MPIPAYASPARQVLPLDGTWSLTLDPEDRGVEEAWFQLPGKPSDYEVDVPSVWDRWIPGYDGVGWYYRVFTLPPEWKARHCELRFEAADYAADVWLNGTRLGGHEGGYTPFSFHATPHLIEGENFLAVRVVDPHGPAGHGPYQPKAIPCAKENGYYSFAGIWGSVWLESRPKVHIEDVFIQPDLRRKRLAVRVESSGPAAVHLHIEGTDCHAEGPAGDLSIDFPAFECWSPESPTLYTLRAELAGDDVDAHDRVDTRFGMREFTIKENRFFLNGRPYFVKGVLHQPDYPRTLAAPETHEMARRELEQAKAAGFNMVRCHIKPAPPITLELADELGLLVYAEPAIGWIEASPHMAARCQREVEEMILRDRNHPSVVVWGMLNESGNAGYKTGGGAQVIKDELCMLARRLDPSRLIIDDSGGVNATREASRFMRPYREELEPYDDLHIYQRAPVDPDITRYYQHHLAPGGFGFLSEFGFGGPEPLAEVLAQYGEGEAHLKDRRFLEALYEAAQRGFEDRKLDRAVGDFDGLLAQARELQADAARLHIDAIRANPRWAGYCYTQLCDAGHEFCAGVMDRWRRPKPVFRALQAAQQPVRPIIQAAKTNLATREEVSIEVLLANETKIEGRADLSLQVVGPTNQVLWKKKRNVKLPRHLRELWTGEISASGSAGTHTFVVRVMRGFQVIAEASLEFHVSEPAAPSEEGIHVLDPRKEWQARCGAWAKASNLLAPVHIIPPLANTIRAYPDNALLQILAQVKAGAVALFFAPPADWNDLAGQLEGAPEATAKDAVGGFLPACHYVKLHPVFEKLPSRGLMRQPYANIVPPRTFLEGSDEDISGTFDTAPLAAGNYMMGESAWWGSDILVRRFGSGRLVFTHLRVLEHLGADPVANRLFVNLINHFARRSLPSETPQPVNTQAVEWLRGERTAHVRRWMVVGEFPNWNGEGHHTAYPPEKALDFQATYPGWYRAISWRPWFTRDADGHRLDMQEAFSPIYQYYPRFDYATGYAYAEFNCDKRQEIRLDLATQNPTKIWINGNYVDGTKDYAPHDGQYEDSFKSVAKQGKNSVLVKCSKIPGPFAFSLDLVPMGRETLPITWWK